MISSDRATSSTTSVSAPYFLGKWVTSLEHYERSREARVRDR